MLPFSTQKPDLSFPLSQVCDDSFLQRMLCHSYCQPSLPTAHSAPIRSITFTSSLLITASDDKRINVFDLRALTAASTGAAGGGSRRGQVASLGGHEGWVVSVEARNERLLASGSVYPTLSLFSLKSDNAFFVDLPMARSSYSIFLRPPRHSRHCEITLVMFGHSLGLRRLDLHL